MARERLLSIEPQELTFPVVLRTQASCTIWLRNNSRGRVAFKVMTTTPTKYLVRPNIGILEPGSTCDVRVTMYGLEEIPPDMQCRDRFLIKSVVARPGDTVQNSRELFNENGHVFESFKLRVVYVLPSHQQSSNFERSRQGSSQNGSVVRPRSVNDNEVIQRQDGNGWDVGDLFMKSIAVIFLCLVFWYLIVMMLPLIWSLTFMIILFVIKLGKRLVSDSIEDWIGRTTLYLVIHFFTAFFRRRESRSEPESRVSNVE